MLTQVPGTSSWGVSHPIPFWDTEFSEMFAQRLTRLPKLRKPMNVVLGPQTVLIETRRFVTRVRLDGWQGSRF